jgi:hypothetical protein
MIAAARHLRLVTDDDLPPAIPLRPGQQLLAFALRIAPRQPGHQCRFPRPKARQPRQFDLPLTGPLRRTRRWVRPKSIGNDALTKSERASLDADAPRLAVFYETRPTLLGDCLRQGYLVVSHGPCLPCPWASCRHHLQIEVKEATGNMLRPTIKENFPGRDFDELEETCSFRGPLRGDDASQERVGELLNITMQRVDQIEKGGCAKAKWRRGPRGFRS